VSNLGTAIEKLVAINTAELRAGNKPWFFLEKAL